MRTFTTVLCLVVLGLVFVPPCAKPQARGKGVAQEERKDNKQAMAATPDALVQMLSDLSFLPPESYRLRMKQAMRQHIFPFDLKPIPQITKQGRYASIRQTELAAYGEKLAAFGKQAKDAGEILWGRIQGTQYERAALRWLYEKLESFGIDDVRHDTFPTAFPQWRPTACDLEIIAAPGFARDESYRFEDALTAFASATTPEGGVTGEIVYVGDGTPADLKGRELSGKIVLLRARTYPSTLMNSARTALPRIATGRYGKPLGVVVWWEIPHAKQVAGRVGAVGGGDDLGKGLPWTSIGNDAGFYLRKLLDRSTEETPVIARLNVQGQEEPPEKRLSGNVYGILPGRPGKYIVVMTHVDGYFYGLHDNGAAVALNLALAKYYASHPEAERAHGIVFLFEGDHEVPGVGGTIPFIERNRKLVSESLLLVLRLEHTGITQTIHLGEVYKPANVARPSTLLITNRSPVLQDIFRRAITDYALSTAQFLFVDPAADEAAFHPPYNDLNAISAGFGTMGPLYHTPMDVERKLVNFKEVEKMARAHAFIIDVLGPYTKEDLERDGAPPPAESVYRSDFFKLYMGNF